MCAMPSAETFLAVDVGSINTRACLFDVVGGHYRLVATGRATTTAKAPLFDINEGVRLAINRIELIAGRRLINESDTLIMPSTGFGAGVDLLAATTSAGPPVRTMLVGLMPDVSLASARRLATSTYLEVVGELNLIDRQRGEEQIDLILSAEPDMILIVGGTDGGANESLLQLVHSVSVAIGLIPENKRPWIVYAGNRLLGASVGELISNLAPVVFTPNVRPDLEQEDLSKSRLRLAEAIIETRSASITGYDELKQWAGGNIMLTAHAFGRVICYLSRIGAPELGVLGVDLGANQVTVAAGFAGNLSLTTRTDLGIGNPLPRLLEHCSINDIRRWLPFEISESQLRDYIYNKSLYPATVPIEKKELQIELALARQLIRSAIFLSRADWPEGKNIRSSSLLPQIETILAGGGVLSRTPSAAYAALTLIDGIQPIGVTNLVMDPYNLTAALGVVANPLPLGTIQVLESISFPAVATVVAPVGQDRPGRPVLHIRLDDEDGGHVFESTIHLGQLTVFPFEAGRRGLLTLRPESGFDVGLGGAGRAGTVKVSGSALGIVADGRGRPLQFPVDEEVCRQMNKAWLEDMGAKE